MMIGHVKNVGYPEERRLFLAGVVMQLRCGGGRLRAGRGHSVSLQSPGLV